MAEMYEMGKRVLAAQPFSALMGTRLEKFEPGTAVLSLAITRDHHQQHGFVHGGVISYLADNALTYAGGSVLQDSVTSEYKINYLRPARGEKLIARAAVISAGKRQAVCRCEIFCIENGVELNVAHAIGTINKFELR